MSTNQLGLDAFRKELNKRLEELYNAREEQAKSIDPNYAELIAELRVTRAHTFATIERVSRVDLERVHSPLMSPIVWDLAHIAAFADLWLARVTGSELIRPDLVATYDAGETPRPGRGALELLELPGALRYLEQVDAELEAAVAGLDFGPSAPPLLRDGFLVDLLVEHEQQHRETILQTLHLAEPGVLPARLLHSSVDRAPIGNVLVPGGAVRVGLSEGFGYDNERPEFVATVAPFRIDRTPVTVAAWRAFINDAGYSTRPLWSERGWAWREAEQAERPLFWNADGTVRLFDRILEPRDDEPVMNVSYFEADAFARWRGARLPSELEWEAAARLDPATGISTIPGNAADALRVNVDGNALGPLPPLESSAAVRSWKVMSSPALPSVTCGSMTAPFCSTSMAMV